MKTTKHKNKRAGVVMVEFALNAMVDILFVGLITLGTVGWAFYRWLDAEMFLLARDQIYAKNDRFYCRLLDTTPQNVQLSCPAPGVVKSELRFGGFLFKHKVSLRSDE